MALGILGGYHLAGISTGSDCSATGIYNHEGALCCRLMVEWLDSTIICDYQTVGSCKTVNQESVNTRFCPATTTRLLEHNDRNKCNNCLPSRQGGAVVGLLSIWN